ncbi:MULTISPECIES: polysaccharide deacetylase family protein [Methylococcus]|uniref:Polysaccharide deacetylase family protein n=1 Tax=Methylococcus capsulatus TaxID=414 RepID=A0ABZ2F3P0_METCP|nr:MULTISPECIES: polysaccharide deacetylase family protein [Methylococcus]MDF9391881.1 polysaccharide deacetylase family protein [Methylococcus capsulatus]
MKPRQAGRWTPSVGIKASMGFHAAASVLALWRPDDWLAALGAVAANHVLLTAAGLWPHSRLLGPIITRLPAAAAARGEVAITIDDGPDPEVTPQVLDILEVYGATVTFFCIGRKVREQAELCAEMAARGHALENHSYSHSHMFSLCGLSGFERELRLAQEALTAVYGTPPQFFRAPAGLRNPLLDPVLARLGLSLVSWTRRGFDTRSGQPRRVLAALTRRLRAGDILLLHDGNAARTRGGRPVILEVLPPLLEAIRQRRLRPVTLRAACP